MLPKVVLLTCIPDKVNVMGVPATGTKDPVLVSEVSVSTLFEISPVNNAPPNMKASGAPANGMLFELPTSVENVMTIVPPAGTVANELNVMTKFWHAVALDWQVGNETAVTSYPETGPVEARAAVVSAVVVTLMPVSSPPVAVAVKETPLNVRAITEAAGIAAVPVSTNLPSFQSLKV